MTAFKHGVKHCIPICGVCLASSLSSFTLAVRSDTSHGRNAGAVVTLIRYSITVSLREDRQTTYVSSRRKDRTDKLILCFTHTWSLRQSTVYVTVSLELDTLHVKIEYKHLKASAKCINVNIKPVVLNGWVANQKWAADLLWFWEAKSKKQLKINLVPDAKAAENHCIMPHALDIIDNMFRRSCSVTIINWP